MSVNQIYGVPAGTNGVQHLRRQGMVEESVRLLTGDIWRTISIASVPTLGPDLHFMISNALLDEDFEGPLGHKWRHGYEGSIEVGASLVTVYGGGGERSDYIPDGLGGWTLDVASTMYNTNELTNPGAGSIWELKTVPDGTIRRFDANPISGYPDTAGRLTEIEDRNGNVLTLHYTSGKLSSIEECEGREITLGYTGDLITSVTDPESNVTYLTYDAYDNLTNVSGPEGCTVTFVYWHPEIHRITGITDARSNTTEYYHIADKLSRITYPNGEVISYEYLSGTDAPEEYIGDSVKQRFTTTLVTQPSSEVYEYRFDNQGNLWRTISPSGHIQRFFWSSQQKFLYSSEGFPLFRYGLHGPSDNVNNRFIRHTVNERGDTIATMAPNGIVDTFIYDSEGRMLSRQPGQANYGVQGDWPSYYGSEGVILCGFNEDDSDVYRAPSYLDSTLSTAITNGDGSGGSLFVGENLNATSGIIDPRAPVLGDGSIKSSVGFWRQSGSTALGAEFQFAVNLTESKAFDLSLYSHSADHAKMSIQPLKYYEQFGREITLEVEDIHGVQTFYMPNNAPGVWVTFHVEGDASNPIKVTVTAAGDNDQPVLSAIAFDPLHDRRNYYEYTGGNLTKFYDSLGNETVYGYNTDGTLATVTDARGKTTTFSYLDTYKHLTKITDDDSNETVMTRDDNGNILTITDARSNVTTMTYDGKNRLLTVTDALSNLTQFEYDSNGNVLSVTDPKNRQTLFTYDEVNRLIEVEDPLGQKVFMTYDSAGRLESQTDSRGLVTRYRYNSEGLLSEVESPDSQKTTMSYNALNMLVALTSPNGNQEALDLMNLISAGNLFLNDSFENDDPNRASQPDHWYESGNSYSYASGDIPTGEAAMALSLSQTQWYQKKLELPEGARFVAKATVKRDQFDLVMEAQLRDLQGAAVTQSHAESLAREKFDDWAETDPFVFDVPGDAQTTTTNPTCVQFNTKPRFEQSKAGWIDDMQLYMLSQAYHHDSAGGLKNVTTPDGAKVSLHRDRLGRVNVFEDPRGWRTTLVHDVRDRVISLVKPSGETLQFAYNEVGALVSFLDGELQETTFSYDNLNRVAVITYPDTSTEEFDYDEVGNLSSYTDNAGQTVTFAYDELNRLETITYADTTTVQMTYDEVGNLLTLTERNGDQTTYVYDDLDRVTSITRAKDTGNTTPEWELHHNYDAAGNRLSLSDGSGELWRIWGFPSRYGSDGYGSERYSEYLYGSTGVGAAEYGESFYGGDYDTMNRPIGVTKGDTVHASFRYDHEGRRTAVEFANGTTSGVAFDIMGRPLQIATLLGSSNLLTASYGYDIASNRTRQVTGNDTFDYLVDEDGKLVRESVNRMVLGSTEEFAKGELEGLGMSAGSLELLSLDDSFDGEEIDCDRWLLSYVDGGGRHPDDTLGCEARQKDGLHMRFPRGYSNRTYYRDTHQPFNDDYGTNPGGFGCSLEHRAMLSGDFDVRVDLQDSQGTGYARPSFCLSNMPFQTQGYGSWLRVEHYVETGQITVRRNGAGNSSMTAPSTPTTMKIERSGSAITVSVWDSSTSSWLTQAGWSFTWTSVDVWPSLSILLENQTTATATWKNFQFNVLTSLAHTASGTYTTPVYDAGRNVAWNTLSWQETLPSGSDLKLQVAVSDSPVGPWSYVGPDGTSGTFFTTASGESVGTSVISRYCRVKAYLEGDGTVTPTLEQLELSYSGNITSAYQSFSYDDAGNLTEKESVNDSGAVTETRTYNSLNELVDNEIDDGTTPVTWTYTHDDNGNMVSKTDGTDTFDYTWDDQNRLIEVEFNSVSVVTYEYDSASRMIQRTEGGTTTNYTWDGWDLIREEKTGTVTETTNYLVPFGEVLAFERGGEWYYLHGDALSSTQLVTDESGTVVGRYVFGAWGDELISSESVPGILENKFVGGLGCRRDSATGLVYMRHRWYDVGIQRFVSRDPIGLAGGTNLFEYVSSSPTSDVDPNGMCPSNPFGTTFSGSSFATNAIRMIDNLGYHKEAQLLQEKQKSGLIRDLPNWFPAGGFASPVGGFIGVAPPSGTSTADFVWYTATLYHEARHVRTQSGFERADLGINGHWIGNPTAERMLELNIYRDEALFLQKWFLLTKDPTIAKATQQEKSFIQKHISSLNLAHNRYQQRKERIRQMSTFYYAKCGILE